MRGSLLSFWCCLCIVAREALAFSRAPQALAEAQRQHARAQMDAQRLHTLRAGSSAWAFVMRAYRRSLRIPMVGCSSLSDKAAELCLLRSSLEEATAAARSAQAASAASAERARQSDERAAWEAAMRAESERREQQAAQARRRRRPLRAHVAATKRLARAARA
eukprot:4155971-Pleurochrysis_carterae.AAC.3